MSGEEFKQNKVAIIGAGVIGSGWILRFLLNGWDVHVYDLDLTVKKDISELKFTNSSKINSLPLIVSQILSRVSLLEIFNCPFPS